MARFDYTSSPAHPRKIYWIMRDFLNNHIRITRTLHVLPTDITLEAAFHDWIENDVPLPWKEQDEPCVFHVQKGSHCAAWNTSDLEELDCEITINFSELSDEGSFAIYENAISRYPTLKGFSYVVFVLLHEVGHFATAEEAEQVHSKEWTEEEKISHMTEAFANSSNWKDFQRIFQSYHYNQPEEKLATDWAIAWLSDPANRKAAKQFEKKFFAAWRK